MLALSNFSALVEEVLDMDSVDTMEFLIKPDFDDGLAEIGEQMKEIESKMGKELSKVCLLSSHLVYIIFCYSASKKYFVILFGKLIAI